MDTILNKAEEGAKDMYNPGWYLYLPASTDLSDAVSSDNVTKTPVKEISSDFVGKSLEEVASILISASKDVDLNRQFFAVCDKRTESDGNLVLCYVAKEGDGSVDWVRCWPTNASLNLRGLSMSGPTWDELKTTWERKKAKGEDVID